MHTLYHILFTIKLYTDNENTSIGKRKICKRYFLLEYILFKWMKLTREKEVFLKNEFAIKKLTLYKGCFVIQ